MSMYSSTIDNLQTVLKPVIHFIDESALSKELKRATGEIIDLVSKAPVETADLYTPALAASAALDKGDLVSAQTHLGEIMTQVGLTAGVGGAAGQAPAQPLFVNIKNILQSAKDLNDPDKNLPKVKSAVAQLAAILMKEELEPGIREGIQETIKSFTAGDLQRSQKCLNALKRMLNHLEQSRRIPYDHDLGPIDTSNPWA